MKKLILLTTTLLLLVFSSVFAQVIADKSNITRVASLEAFTAELGSEKDTVVIGDMKNPTVFKPQITFTKWDNEEQLSISYDGLSGLTPTITDGIVKIEGEKEGFYFDRSSDSLFKFGLRLLEKPKTNRWVFKISGDLEFVRPASIFKDGVAQHIPEQIGGYKVNSKDGKEKFGFFYQPIFKDAEGKTCPAKLLIENGEYIITVSQEWLDKAVYPVIANDTYQDIYDGSTRAITVNVAQNDLIVVGYSYNSTTMGATISDENTNAYTQLGTGISGFSSVGLQVWYAIANTTNATCTITLSSKTDPGVVCHTYSGMNTSDPYDNHLTYADGSAGTNHATGNLAVSTESGKLFAMWAQESSSDTATATGIWTKRTEDTGHIHFSFDAPFSASGNYTSTWTGGQNREYVCIFAAFNTAGGGAAVKTINGTAIASVKTKNGLAIGSVKTINGAAAQ